MFYQKLEKHMSSFLPKSNLTPMWLQRASTMGVVHNWVEFSPDVEILVTSKSNWRWIVTNDGKIYFNLSIFCNEAMHNFDFTANGMNPWPGDAALLRVSCYFWNSCQAISWQHSPPTHSFTRYWWIGGHHRLQLGLRLARQLLAPLTLHWSLSGPFLFVADC